MNREAFLEALDSLKSLEQLSHFETTLEAPLQKSLVSRLETKRRTLQKLTDRYESMSTFERQYSGKGYQAIAGIDEAGRGPLAGPVVAAAVVLNPEKPILGLNDSKKLSEKVREALYEEILENAISYGIGFATCEEIDEINILQATKRASVRAVGSLERAPDVLLLDALKLDVIKLPQVSLIKGDQRSVSIAAASIIAKVTRDHYMKRLALKYPEYGFEAHKGYGTVAHYEALRRHGLTPEHRHSFLKSL